MYRSSILAVVLVASCQPPPPQQTYFQGQAPPPPYPSTGYQQPQPAYQPPPQPQYQQPIAPAPAPTATCSQDLTCYGQCNPLTEPCINTCDARTSPSDVQRAHTVLQCMGQSGCKDQNCVLQRCNAQLSACTGTTIAAAPTAPRPAPSAPVSSGGGGITPGRYACQALEYTASTTPHFVPSTMGAIEIDASGRYHAPQFNGGDGTTSLNGHLLTFVGGSLAGWVVYADESLSGKFIRFDSKNHQHPADSAHLGDSICYIQK